MSSTSIADVRKKDYDKEEAAFMKVAEP